MGVILNELTHTHNAMQAAGWFIPVAAAKLRHAQRQIAVRFAAQTENLNMAWAVHWLKRQNLFRIIFIRGGGEHVLAELFPVTRFFPKHTIHKLRRTNFLIPGIIKTIADIGFDLTIKLQPLVMPEDRSLGLFLHMEQVHLAAKATVIALLGFFEHVQIGIKVFFALPARPIDALEHRVIRIATPIGTGHLHQFEGLADFARGRRMRAAAQINKITLTVTGNGLGFRQIADDFGFIVLAFLKEELDRLIAVPDFTHDRLVAFNDLVHLLFDLDQIVGRERGFAGEIVIKAVFNRRANGDLRVGIKLLNGFGHHVRAIVTDQGQNLFMPFGHDFDGRIGVNLTRKVAHFAVDDDGKGFLCQ